MKSRLVLSMLTVAVMLLLAASCGDNPSSVVNENTTEVKTDTINLSVVETVGNNSYIPLNLYSTAYSSRKLILHVKKKFEEENSDLEIISYEIDKEQSAAYTKADYVFGIWVHHRPKK